MFLTLYIVYSYRRTKNKEMALKTASWSGIICCYEIKVLQGKDLLH